MSKLIYIDTETTGLDAGTNGLTQIAAIVVIDGREEERIALNINPYSYTDYAEDNNFALRLTSKTREMVSEYPDQRVQLYKFIDFMGRYISLGNSKDIFQLVGYNTSFDKGFIKQWLKINRMDFSTFFSHKDVDVFALVKHMRLWGMLNSCKNDKLDTICEHFNIELDAHDAMNDIVATRKLYKCLMNALKAGTAANIEELDSLL